MSTKNATYISLILFILVALGYYMLANALPDRSSAAMGADFFPKILSVLLIILCLIGLLQNRKKQHDKIRLPNVKLILVTILLISALFVLWTYTNIFYPYIFLFLVSLFTIYNPKFARNKILKDIILALFIVIIIYLLFGLMMGVRF